MSFNGSGTFNPYVPGNPVVTGTVISSTAFNATIQDIAAGLTNAVTRDGQSPPTADLPMAGRKLTGLAAGVVPGDSVRFEQLPTGQLAGTLNKIINGNPLINQRVVSGTVTLAAGAYGHDRWKAGASGCTYTFATSANVTTLTITAGSLIQVVEGLNLQSGTYTLSWTGTAQGKIGAGSYAASGVTGSITGGTNTNVEFNTGTLSLVQLEPGTTATPFEHRYYSTELALCQRYYQTASISVYSFASGSLGASGLFPVVMRAAPTITRTGNFLTAAEAGSVISAPGPAVFQATQASGTAVGGTFTAVSEL